MRNWCALVALAALGQAFAADLRGVVVSVADGDTLTVLSADHTQVRIRLASIDAPEKAQPFGRRSRQSLAELCARKLALVADKGQDRYGRTIGIVYCDGQQANAEQVRRGLAWVYEKYSRDPQLMKLQADARNAGLGLWADARPIAPWDWRRKAPPKL